MSAAGLGWPSLPMIACTGHARSTDLLIEASKPVSFIVVMSQLFLEFISRKAA